MTALSERLKKIAEITGKTGCFGDVGTDHAFLPIYLLLAGKISTAIASDNREGPLARARQHMSEEGVQIDLRLCDGLTGYAPRECDTICIAGMGGLNIAGILRNSAEVAQTARLILQPNSCRRELRKFLIESGYEITDENCIEEDGHVYLFLTAEYSGRKDEWTDAEYVTGRILQGKKEGVIYLNDLRKKYLRKEEGLQSAEGDVSKELSAVREVLKRL